MGIAFAISERDRQAEKDRLAQKRSTSFKRSIKFVRKSQGGFAAFNFFWTNWELYLAPWQQLLVWYFVLLLLTGVGGAIFWFFEYSTETGKLNYRQEFQKKIQQTFEDDQEKYDLVLEWGQKSSEFMDVNLWGWRYASFFAATTFSTIGFGVQYPHTVWGRNFVVFYGAPAIVCYAYCAKKIGELFLEGVADILISTCLSKRFFTKYRLRIFGFILLVLTVLMALLIEKTATDAGFGNGIYNYWHAVYFLGTTTFTIGYGDVMMSGSSTPLTLCIGAWLSTTLGVTLCFLQEMSKSLKNTSNRGSTIIDIESAIEQEMRQSQIDIIESQIYKEKCLIDSISLIQDQDSAEQPHLEGQNGKKSNKGMVILSNAQPIEVQPTFQIDENKTNITNNNLLKSRNNKKTYITNNNLQNNHNDNSTQKKESKL